MDAFHNVVSSIYSNWIVRGDKVYTEDNILVYNIFVYKIPRNHNTESLCAYFERFGKVLKMELSKNNRNNKRNAPRVCFIHFKDATDAAKVLQKTIHKVDGRRIRVKPCDSWRQPNADIFPPYNAKFSNNLENISTSAILKLNDDCLDHIFKMLTLRDKLFFSATCLRFRNIFIQRIGSEHKSLILDELPALTLWEIREFLILAGPSIESVNGSLPLKYLERIAEFIGKYCSNLKIICLDSCEIKRRTVAKLMPKNNCVTELHLKNCALHDDAIVSLKHMRALKKLTLSKNLELTGANLSKLKFLTELNLDVCVNIQPKHMIEICKSLKYLTSLNIQHCHSINTDVINQIVESCSRLEKLKISYTNVSYEQVARLPNLKHLEIVSNYARGVRVELFKELVEHKATQLTHLKIGAGYGIRPDIAALISRLKGLKELHCYNSLTLTDECLNHFSELENLEVINLKNCSGFTKYGVQDLLSKCTKLTHIMMQGWIGVTNEFLDDAIKILSKRGNELRNPLLFSADNNEITRAILKDEKYLKAKSVIKLILKDDRSEWDDPILGFEGFDINYEGMDLDFGANFHNDNFAPNDQMDYENDIELYDYGF